ncbi:MAG: DegV family protein [Acidimicrobiales bacterium]|nr:DegV family protein [Acidimicrobiales bacterium]
MTVKIVTDSAADLTVEQADSLGVRIVPLTIRFGEEEFVDVIELTADQFYEKMAAEPTLPATAAPSPGAFEEAIRAAGAEGDQVIVINISGDLSATVQSAENAKRSIGDEIDVRVFDSKSITATLGLKVIAAAEAAAAGKDADEIITMLEDLRSRSRVYGALNTLDNLKKGGRIGGAQAMLGSMLSIKPIVDISDGSVHEAAKVRTRKKALVWLRDRVFAEPQLDTLALCSGNADDTEELLDLIAERYPRDKVQIWTIGPVIGAHGGPGVLGLAWHQPN